MSVTLALHVIAAVVWVGGMFFAYLCLRPSAARLLEPAQRLSLWAATFERFFVWVWLSIVTLLATGYWMVFAHFGGFATTPIYVHAMQGLGILMMLIFLHVFFAPYRRLRRAVQSQDWAPGGGALAQIRILVAVNLGLGIATIAIASAGAYLI